MLPKKYTGLTLVQCNRCKEWGTHSLIMNLHILCDNCLEDPDVIQGLEEEYDSIRISEAERFYDETGYTTKLWREEEEATSPEFVDPFSND